MTVTNFKSDGTGQMVVQPKTGQGVGKILDDNGIAGSSSAVRSLDVLSSTNSQTAISTIDRALENVASERSKLGAAVNRLDHTINNLSNVSTNTAAAKSRIVDADFAAETSNSDEEPDPVSGRDQHAGPGQPVEAGHPGTSSGLSAD